MIRDARQSDAKDIAAIWNLVIRGSVATFNSIEKSKEEVEWTIADRQRQGLPFLVHEGTAVDGFATYFQFRSGVGYRHTMEHTIHLLPSNRQQGCGRAMMAELEHRAVSGAVHSLIGGISGENTGAIRFHAAIGFSEVARLTEVGRKFGRWFDLVLMQKVLPLGSWQK